MMKRKAFKMTVYPDKIDEYIKRHNPIWDELRLLLKEHGVYNYSIFLDREQCELFGYAEIESEEKWEAVGQAGICKKWWSYMADLMETNEDDSPVSREIEEVFHMD